MIPHRLQVSTRIDNGIFHAEGLQFFTSHVNGISFGDAAKIKLNGWIGRSEFHAIDPDIKAGGVQAYPFFNLFSTWWRPQDRII